MKQPWISDDTLGALAAMIFVISLAALVGMLLLEDRIVLWWMTR